VLGIFTTDAHRIWLFRAKTCASVYEKSEKISCLEQKKLSISDEK
jgi:hypothetical protein